MSNTLAISTVNAAMQRRVLSAASAAVDTAKVRLGPPTAKLSEDGAALVNVHLFRVETNLQNANAHLPTRNPDSTSRGPSKLALDLHYVLSFYGNSDKFEPDQMLAAVMLAFEHEPELSRQTIDRTISETDDLADSDLDKALARLRVTREILTLDDFSKIWSIFYQVPYTLSLSYVVCHVVIQTAEAARIALPVARAGIWVSPLRDLRLETASGASTGLAPVVWGNTLFVTGQGLGQTGLDLTVDGQGVVMAQVLATPSTLAIPMATSSFATGSALAVGVHALRAVAPPQAATMPAHLRGLSNTLAFALHPACTPGAVTAPAGGTTATGTVAVAFSPAIAADQQVRLLLDARDPAAPAQHVLPSPARAGPVDAITFGFTGLPRGSYLLRADVDGLLSPVEFQTDPASPAFGQIIGPLVVL